MVSASSTRNSEADLNPSSLRLKKDLILKQIVQFLTITFTHLYKIIKVAAKYMKGIVQCFQSKTVCQGIEVVQLFS